MGRNALSKTYEEFETGFNQYEIELKKLQEDNENLGATFFKTESELSAELLKRMRGFFNNKELVLTEMPKGALSPVFIDYENAKGGVTSLTDFRGKYVYIDIWATWCSPCKIEIPYLQKIEKAYHGKNIEFVSISVDKQKDRDKWKKMIEKEKLTGVQLLTDADYSSKFIEDVKTKGIPRFILIDPEGKIVDAYAPRPSDPKLQALLNSLTL